MQEISIIILYFFFPLFFFLAFPSGAMTPVLSIHLSSSTCPFCFRASCASPTFASPSLTVSSAAAFASARALMAASDADSMVSSRTFLFSSNDSSYVHRFLMSLWAKARRTGPRAAEQSALEETGRKMKET